MCPYDTGLLRNSIAYARAGEGASPFSYKADRGGESGEYTGIAPQDKEGTYTVYIGTKVECAEAVALGIGKKTQHPEVLLNCGHK